MNKWVVGMMLGLLLGWVTPGEAAVPVLVQTPAKCQSAVTVGALPCSFAAPVSAGNTVVVMATIDLAPSTSTVTVTDTVFNPYGNAAFRCAISACNVAYIASNVTGGFTQVTVTQSTAAKMQIQLFEVSGAANPPIDVVASNASAVGNSSFSSGTTVTTTVTDELIIAALGVDVNLNPTAFTIAGGWTERARETNATNFGMGWSVVTKTVTALGTQEHTWSAITTQGPPSLLGITLALKSTPATQTLPTGCTMSWTLGSESDLMGYYIYVDLLAVTLGPANRHDVGFVTSATCASLGINADGTYHAQLSAYDTSRNESTKVNPAAPNATSFTLTGTSGTQTLSPPAILTPLNGVDPTQAVFSWVGVTGATGYIVNVHETAQPSIACNATLTNNTLPNYCATITTNQFTLDLLPNTDYNWWICSKNAQGTCGLSNGNSFTTGSTTNLVQKTITWSWSGLDANGAKTDITGFRVQRSSSLTGTWTLLTAVGPEVRSYVDPAPLSPVSCYRIDVVNVNQTITVGPVSSANCTGTSVPTVTTPPSSVFSVEVQ